LSRDGSQALFVLSAPAPDQRWEGALAPSSAYAGLQSLLGWDAQLKSFATALQQAGARCYATPAPELFFTRTALEVLAPRIGVTADQLSRAVHIRFGPARFGRVLRGMPNLLANAEASGREILATGNHPFRGHNVAPHAIAEILDLSDRTKPLFRPNGSAIPRHAAPLSLIGADLPASPPPTQSPIGIADFAGLEITTLAEFNADDWSDGKPAGPSTQLRRMILEFNAAAENRARPVILLPWNLANAATCVPDLVMKFTTMVHPRERAPYLVLLPFNATRPAATILWPLIDLMRHQIDSAARKAEDRGDSAQSGPSIARVSSLTAIAGLRRMAAVAWIDGDDPEAEWTRVRFAACAIPALTLSSGQDRLEQGHFAVMTKSAMVEVRDELGQRFCGASTITLRGMERILAIPATSAPPPNAAPTEHRDFLNYLTTRFIQPAP